MDVQRVVEDFSEVNGYRVVHSDNNPQTIIIGEQHYRPNNIPKQSELLEATMPVFVLHEALNDAEPRLMSESDIREMNTLRDRGELDRCSSELLPLMYAANKTGAKLGGCSIDRRAHLKNFLSKYPGLENVFGEDPNEGLEAFFHRFAEDVQTEDDKVLAVLVKKIFIDDGYLVEMDVGMASRFNIYGKQGLTFGILGVNHLNSSVFQNSLNVRYVGIDTVPPISLRPCYQK